MRRRNTSRTPWPRSSILLLLAAFFFLALPADVFALGEPVGVIPEPEPAVPICSRTLQANVVALDQPYFWNRLGAVQPHGMIYALERDVVGITAFVPGPGNAQLRENKRPRPLVLRMNVGDCLTVRFKNWLDYTPVDREQVATREASVHVTGMQLVGSIADDGSYVGQNASSLVAPGGTRYYTFYAEREGPFAPQQRCAPRRRRRQRTISAGL
ncbi:MAG: hypothetical protein HC897_17730, partial [Thermoanaerobaculia bacterium]|nr:hypothetical protein [Thermoanaerobaculia bacterium]